MLVLTLLTVASPTAWGWKECSISPQDEWKEATEDIPAMRMRAEYERGYTCATSEDASFMAANYYFDSPCLAKRFFYPPDVRECLRGRRVIFLGDSVSNQQGDSLVGMLGWHPEWMPRGGPRNKKLAVREDGTSYFTLVDCWHPPGGSISGIERCYDVYDTDFPFEGVNRSPGKPSLEGHVSTTENGESASTEGNHDRRNKRRSGGEVEEVKGLEGEGKEEEKEEVKEEVKEEEEGGVEEGEEEGEEEETTKVKQTTSVHVRMTSVADDQHWLRKALRDYNETRASDVVVINFGAHYRSTPEGEESFKRDVSSILDDMAEIGETATVVWREIAPTHFPAENGTYEAFVELDLGNTACCTGTPVKLLDKNAWVEDYVRDNGLSDSVRLLRIYDMSVPRGAAHHTCHRAPPSTMDQAGAESDYCHSFYATDCRHWSETGVVEEWNALLLNHLCPMA
ncbi:unnamed protein product [Ectocarpus sp. 12 AP-2014]